MLCHRVDSDGILTVFFEKLIFNILIKNIIFKFFKSLLRYQMTIQGDTTWFINPQSLRLWGFFSFRTCPLISIDIPSSLTVS